MKINIILLPKDEVFESISPDAYLDIHELNKYYQRDSKFLDLYPYDNLPSVKVVMPDIETEKLLVKKTSIAISGKDAINSRIINFLIFEFGLFHLEIDLNAIIKMKGLIKLINECGSIRGDFEFGLEGIMDKGNEGFPMFLSPKQLEKLKEITGILGCRSESTVAVMSIIYSACNTFRNLDERKKNKILGVNPKVFDMVEDSEERKEAERLLSLEPYYKDSGLLKEIKEKIKLYEEYEEKLSKYIKMSYLHFKELESYNERLKIQMPCVSKIIKRIENEGWCNRD